MMQPLEIYKMVTGKLIATVSFTLVLEGTAAVELYKG